MAPNRMNLQPSLSVLLYFRNQASEVEAFLDQLFSNAEPEIEWILIDDDSDDETASIIDRVIEHQSNDRIYFFQQDSRKGRAQSFNDAIQHINSTCVWTSHRLLAPKQKSLLKSCQSFLESDKPLAIHSGVDIPTTAPAWLQAIKEGVHIPDECFLLRVDSNLQNRYFNPFLEQSLLFELALRTRDELEVFVPSGQLSGTGCELILLSNEEQIELCFSLVRTAKGLEQLKAQAMEIISPYQQNETNLGETELNELLESAYDLVKENDLPAALEKCERILQHQPFHQPTLELKVNLLEKLKQFVAASELKHRLKRLQKEKKDASTTLSIVKDTTDESKPEVDDEQSSSYELENTSKSHLTVVPTEETIEQETEEEPEEISAPIEYDIHTTIIIPTTAGGRPALEHCLTRLYEHANPVHYELVIVNNASQDDTDELIEQLENDAFLQCRSIMNHSNKGVAASYAQAMSMARGKYVLLLHNDCLIEEGSLEAMFEVMEAEEDVFICGPLTNTALLEEQLMPEDFEPSEDSTPWIEVPYLDGCCLYLRLGKGITPDDSFYPAYFEEMDLCWQVRSKSGKCAVSTKAIALHHKGYTTSQMGWDENSPTYWSNASSFALKWGLDQEEISVPSEQAASIITFTQIGESINFWKPEPKLLEQAASLMTAELRTQIRQIDAPQDKIRAMLNVAILLDDRELVRTIEDKLTSDEIDIHSIRKLCHYYFQKNIYSRLRTYLGDYQTESLPLDLQILYLEMLIKDKELEEVSPLMERLYTAYPSHPKLNALVAIFYNLTGDLDRSNQFKKKSESLDPSLLEVS